MAVMAEDLARTRSRTTPDILALYDEHAPALLRFLLGVTGRRDWAQDITQESFLRLIAAVGRGETIDAPREWLFTVARNLLRDRLEDRDSSLNKRAKSDSSVNTPDEREADNAALRRLMRRLASPRELEILELRSEGFTYEETARILGIAPGTVGSLLARAIRKIRDALKREGRL